MHNDQRKSNYRRVNPELLSSYHFNKHKPVEVEHRIISPRTIVLALLTKELILMLALTIADSEKKNNNLLSHES